MSGAVLWRDPADARRVNTFLCAAGRSGYHVNASPLYEDAGLDVRFLLLCPRGRYVGFLIYLLDDLRPPTPEEWNELRKAREAGLFAAVCYNTEYAVNAMSNYCTDGLMECSSAAAVFRPRRPYSRADDLRFLL